MKILLISPPRAKPQREAFPPIGLAYLSAVAKEQGHTVNLLDAASWYWEDLTEAITSAQPDLVGITCWTIERGQALKTAQIVKQVAPSAAIVLGGPHATAFPEHIFIKTPADYVVMGEGEETFRELLGALAEGREVGSISGLAYRVGGQTRINPPRPFIKDLDILPLPDHGQFDYGEYVGMHDYLRRVAPIISSRGCPFNCTFCSSTVYWGRQYRKRSVPNVMREIEMLYTRYGIRGIFFFDDNLTIDRERCIALSKALLERKWDLVWAGLGTVRIDAEMLGWMKRSGCYRLDFGVESGSAKVLKNINKAFRADDARRAFKLCREAGIRPNAYLMTGAPGETWGTLKETIRLMRDIQPTINATQPGIWLLPQTELYRRSVEEGIITDQSWLESDETFVYTGEYSKVELKRLADRFLRAMEREAGWQAGWGKYVGTVCRQMIGPRVRKAARILFTGHG